VSALAAPKKAAMTDQQFLNLAAQTDMVEAHLGQMAQTDADSQDVKDYGQMLVTDHTKDFDQLYTLAKGANLTRPDSISEEMNKTMIAPFEKLKGKAFDKKFEMEMVAGHTKAIAVYKKEAEDAESPAVKAYAAATIPTLQEHLDKAKDLAKAKK